MPEAESALRLDDGYKGIAKMKPVKMKRVLLAQVICVTLLAVCAGCSDSDGGTVVPRTLTTGSGLFVVECNIMRAFVPLLQSPDPATGNGRISVIDLSVDPNTVDPRKATVVLSHADNPTGTASDPDDGLIIVISGSNGAGGFIDLLKTDTNTLTSDSPILMPTGVEPGSTGQVLWDPVRRVAIIAVEANASCTSTCTGFITFDPQTRSFGSVVSANYAETFAFNAQTNVLVDASDDDSTGKIGLVDLSAGRNCVLSDDNISDDSDGVAIDFNTNIAVISNEFDDSATVLNLTGSSFNGAPPSCVATEGGAPPNSVLITGLPSEIAGSTVNPETHEAFLITDAGAGIVLLTLPSSPVTQLNFGMVSSSESSIPITPAGGTFNAQGDPYAVAIDVCNNVGYAVDDSSEWLAGIDLATMKSNPSSISAPLPSGGCAGTTTSSACSNGTGVTFFPLPPVSEP